MKRQNLRKIKDRQSYREAGLWKDVMQRNKVMERQN